MSKRYRIAGVVVARGCLAGVGVGRGDRRGQIVLGRDRVRLRNVRQGVLERCQLDAVDLTPQDVQATGDGGYIALA